MARRDTEASARTAGRARRALLDALAADLGKPALEAWITEIGFTIADINHTLAHLGSWTKPDRVATPIASAR